MPSRRRRSGALLALGATLMVAATAHAADPALGCRQQKNRAAGKYASCRQKAEARYVASFGDTTLRNMLLAKCGAAYTKRWLAVEATAAGACPTLLDDASIRSVVTEHANAVATLLAGGTPPDCPGTLAACLADLASCPESCAPLAARPLRTGQTTCVDAMNAPIPCAGTGQDGELQRGVSRSHVDNGDGTVTDLRPQLTWEKHTFDGSIHCASGSRPRSPGRSRS